MRTTSAERRSTGRHGGQCRLRRRCKDNGELEQFEVFCPKAYAGLDAGLMPDTLLSRSVTIRLDAKLPGDTVERWIAPHVEPDVMTLRASCRAWVDSVDLDGLSRHRPVLPEGLSDRATEVWWALLALAEHAGGDWPHRAHAAARALSAGGDEHDEQPERVTLLADVHDAFDGQRSTSTDALLRALNALEDHPW